MVLGCRKGAREELLAARPLPCAASPESSHKGSCCCAICPGAARLLNGLGVWLAACACAGHRGAQAPGRLRACPARRLGFSTKWLSPEEKPQEHACVWALCHARVALSIGGIFVVVYETHDRYLPRNSRNLFKYMCT